MNKDLIPSGSYCYKILQVIDDRIKIKVCPYWGRSLRRPEQDSGYCLLNHYYDWDTEIGLLWDMVKCCGINEE